MKKIFGVVVVVIALASCGDGGSGQREVEMQDNTVEAPTTSPQTNTISTDTSTSMDVRDSSTTVGYDTSATPRN